MARTGTIIDIEADSIHYQTSIKGRNGRHYEKRPGGYINGAGAFCWSENSVNLYWINDKTGKREYQDIRDKLKAETNNARLTQNRLNNFLALNKGKHVELTLKNGRWEILDLDELDYDFI